MDVTEYADVLNLEIVIRYYPNQEKRFCARFERVEIKEGSMLAGVSGNASTPGDAMRDYITQISGKLAVKNAYGENRLEFTIPKSITVADP